MAVLLEETAIQEGNKTIAEFMGIDFWAAFWNNGETHFNSYRKTKEDIQGLINGSNFLLSNKAVPEMVYLDYHKSWNSLMPVYKKINDDIDRIDLTNESGHQIAMQDALLEADINGVWTNAVALIKEIPLTA